MTNPRTALILGATGLVGGHVLRLLAADARWNRVITLGRRTMEPASATHIHHVIDFDEMDVHTEHFACDDMFCCLGTTIKQAGSKEAFRRVDFGFPVEAAYLAKAQGASQFLLVSSLGANAKSRIFYNGVKGEVERALTEVDFDSLAIFRPSLLAGDRAEHRIGENFGTLALALARPLLVGPFRKYRATPAHDLARVMIDVAGERAAGRTIFEADAIMARAQGMFQS